MGRWAPPGGQSPAPRHRVRPQRPGPLSASGQPRPPPAPGLSAEGRAGATPVGARPPLPRGPCGHGGSRG
jgi:hypothetical protein